MFFRVDLFFVERLFIILFVNDLEFIILFNVLCSSLFVLMILLLGFILRRISVLFIVFNLLVKFKVICLIWVILVWIVIKLMSFFFLKMGFIDSEV